MPAIALTIAGSDPSGGAGLQADLKTFHQFGVYGEAVVTLLTVQNTVSAHVLEYVRADLLRQQIRAVLEDVPPAAAKTGALGTRDIIETVADMARHWQFPLVVDPVMVSKHGAPLMQPDALATFIKDLLPRATLLMPNLDEAAALTGRAVSSLDEMREAARGLCGMGAKAVLVKGGHLEGDAVDILFDGTNWREYACARVPTNQTHGSGCTYAAAVTAELAKGTDLPEAVGRAKSFVHEAILTAPGFGSGAGPLNHFAHACQSTFSPQ